MTSQVPAGRHDRRQFLALGLASAAGLTLPGCGGGGAADPAPAPVPVPTPSPNPTPGPSESDWQALRAQSHGQIVRPGDADYDRLRRVANARYDAQLPLALLRCTRPDDVAAGLTFARQQSLPLVPRGGGHSYLGQSTGPGLVLDLGPMNQVTLVDDVAHIGAGATLADVYDALITQGRCVPSGSCVSVGIAGITQGGGFGVVDRAHGLSCDALLSAQVVTADGKVLECEATQNAELFWALRGGGGGQFAVLTSLRMKTHAISPMLRFSTSFSLNALTAVMSAWQTWPERLPDEVWSQLILLPSGGPGGARCILWGYGVGAMGREAAFLPHWQGLLGRIGTPGTGTSLIAQSYREAMLSDCAGLSLSQCHLPSQDSAGQLRRVAMAASSDFFNKPLDEAGIQALSQAVQERQGRSGSVALNLMGGAIARVPLAATAFPHRQALFSAQYYTDFAPGTSSTLVDDGAQWTHRLRTVMQNWSSGGAYVNYPDGLLTAPSSAYHGPHLARLQQLKRSVDPGGLFRSAQGITAG